MDIARNHTATHLLHAALRNIVGSHALQAGSVVEPGKLRFDFSHFQGLTADEIRKIEDEVNEKILADIPVDLVVTNVDEARKLGAMALFGEKYGDVVRVLKVGDYSVELCGGTHLHRTSEIGFFKLVSESSVGAGLRRIEAVTGRGAVKQVHDTEDMLRGVAEKLGSSPADAAGTVERMQASLKDAQKQIEKMQARSASEKAQELAESAENVGGVNVVTSKLGTADVQVLSALADAIADRLRSGVVVLGGVADGKVLFVSKVTSDLVAKGFHAGNTLREVAKVAGGGGGGRPEFAQAGGRDASKVDEALRTAVDIVRRQAG
jgi:alanyl-tRNA synthetase